MFTMHTPNYLLPGSAATFETENKLDREERLAKQLIVLAMEDGWPQATLTTMDMVHAAAEALGRPFVTGSAHTAHDDLVGNGTLVSIGGAYRLNPDEKSFSQSTPTP